METVDAPNEGAEIGFTAFLVAPLAQDLVADASEALDIGRMTLPSRIDLASGDGLRHLADKNEVGRDGQLHVDRPLDEG